MFGPTNSRVLGSLGKKCSEADVLCTFWLRNLLRATTACNFSSLIWPDGSAPVALALASLLFDPAEPEIIGKTQCFVTFLPFRAPFVIFFLLLFSSLLFSDSPHLCFSSVHIVGSLTSKLPSFKVISLLGRYQTKKLCCHPYLPILWNRFHSVFHGDPAWFRENNFHLKLRIILPYPPHVLKPKINPVNPTDTYPSPNSN